MNVTRRPAGMSSGDWIEALIHQAEREGKFDCVAHAPDPMAGVDPNSADDENWWLKKLINREGLTVMPEMLAVKKDVSALRCGLAEVPNERELRTRCAELNRRIIAADLDNSSPVAKDIAPIDIDQMVGRWRTARMERGWNACWS